MTTKKIGFIGAGNMASALIGGLLASGSARPAQVRAGDPSSERRGNLETLHGVATTAANLEVAAWADVVVLAVKPQVCEAALASFTERLGPSTLLISILAGISTLRLEQGLPAAQRVVRAMPNTPAFVRAGATALCGGQHATLADLELASELFTAVGTVTRVPESLFDVVTALSGSGPGYCMYFLEGLVDGAVEAGMPRDLALELAAQTMLGSAQLQLTTREAPALLRAQVTSPGGTTSAGLAVLEKAGVRQSLLNAISAATDRARTLGNR